MYGAIVRDWLQNNVQNQLKTPPQSPDLNPIEHLWKQVRKQEITTTETLKSVLREEWDKIDQNVTQNLVKSMPSRMCAVIKANGYLNNPNRLTFILNLAPNMFLYTLYTCFCDMNLSVILIK